MTKPIPTKQIDGDVAIGRNIAAGGDANVQGSARIGHDLVVEGYLDAKNIKGLCKGLFKTDTLLKKAFPVPQDGWWALVGASLPAAVWSALGGEWNTTGGEAPTEAGMAIYTQSLENEKGKANGIAPLDASKKVPQVYLPKRVIDVAVFHSIESAGAILSTESTKKSTDEGYGAIFDPTRKRFYLKPTTAQSGGGVSVVQSYGTWADMDDFGVEPAEGYGAEPVGYKLYRCITDGGLYYWDGTDLVDFNAEVNDTLDLHADDINNLENEVTNIKSEATELAATVSALRSEYDDTDDAVSVLRTAIDIRCNDLLKGGTWTWGSTTTTLADIKAGHRITLHYGDAADTEIEGVVLSVETEKNQFEVAVYDGATKSAGMLVLVFTIGAAAQTMTVKKLVESTDARLKHVYNVQFTYNSDGDKATWNKAAFSRYPQQGDELRWYEGESSSLYEVRATVIGESNQDLCAVYFMNEVRETLRVIWLCYDGSVYEVTFDDSNTVYTALSQKQNNLASSEDITLTGNKLFLADKHVQHTHSITLTKAADGALTWSGATHADMRNGDIVEWEDQGITLRGTVISYTSSSSYNMIAVVYDFDGDEPLELHVLWLSSNGTATDACFSSDQTLASAFANKQDKLEDTTDVYIEGETTNTDGLYLTDAAKRAVFNDLFDAAAGSHGGYKPTEAPEAAKPYLLNGIWLSYAEAVKIYAINGADAGRYIDAIGRRYSYYYWASDMNGVKTLFPIWGRQSYLGTFFMCRDLETLHVNLIGQLGWTFRACKKLKTVEGVVDISESTGTITLVWDCPLLENVNIKGLCKNLELRDAPKLSLASMQYLVENASSGITAAKPVVVTVHADVFAKLTGDTTNEAAAALSEAEKTAWAAVLTSATSKHISFATA